MQPVNAPIDSMQLAARKLAVEKYRIDGTKLDQLYDKAIQDMRAQFQKMLQ